MKGITILALLCLSAVTGKADDPVVTIAVDRDDLPWKVEVTNHGSQPLVFETINGLPVKLGIEHWSHGPSGRSGLRLYVGEMAQRISETRFETTYGQVDAGDTRVFLLDPRVVSAENEEVLASWKASYQEFKFYEIRIFFEQFASPLIYEPDKRRDGQTGANKP